MRTHDSMTVAAVRTSETTRSVAGAFDVDDDGQLAAALQPRRTIARTGVVGHRDATLDEHGRDLAATKRGVTT